jgi:hypothetical protein
MTSLYDHLGRHSRLRIARARVAWGGIVILLAGSLLGGGRLARADDASDYGDAGEAPVDASAEAAPNDAEVAYDAVDEASNDAGLAADAPGAGEDSGPEVGADATVADATVADATVADGATEAGETLDGNVDGASDAAADVDIYDLYDGYAATFPRGTGNNAYGCSCQLAGADGGAGYGASLTLLATLGWLGRRANRRRPGRSAARDR